MKHLKPFLWSYMIIVLIELIVVDNPELLSYRFISKPLIMVSMIIFFLLQKVDRKTRIFVSTALFCSLIGDLLLIYDEIYESLFYGGLLAFFTTHLMYAIQFSRSRNKELGIIAPTLVLFFYAASVYLYLHDSLNDFAIPVAIYISAHLIMILFAYLRNDSLTNNSYIYVLSGTFLFMFSDSILAITRFKSDIPFSRILVMAFYSSAQLLVIVGILKGALNTKMKNLQDEYSI
ncbi:lysoplasmalogenase [Aurantibacter sp.]|uniref:lysoplasmalogenase n=1 Tax=Aurantibacter sp. TaxID=2807103 RepID=UPI0032675ED1